MIAKTGDYTIIAYPTFSGLLECKVYKGRCRETRSQGKRMRINGYPTFLAKSIGEAKRTVREEFGCDTQSSLEDF